MQTRTIVIFALLFGALALGITVAMRAAGDPHESLCAQLALFASALSCVGAAMLTTRGSK